MVRLVCTLVAPVRNPKAWGKDAVLLACTISLVKISSYSELHPLKIEDNMLDRVTGYENPCPTSILHVGTEYLTSLAPSILLASEAEAQQAGYRRQRSAREAEGEQEQAGGADCKAKGRLSLHHASYAYGARASVSSRSTMRTVSSNTTLPEEFTQVSLIRL